MRLNYNGLRGRLGAALGSGDTTITFDAALTHGGGPVPTIAGNYIAVSLLDSNLDVAEVVHLTSYEQGSLVGTIERGQEGTLPESFGQNSRWVSGVTADMLNSPVAPSTYVDGVLVGGLELVYDAPHSQFRFVVSDEGGLALQEWAYQEDDTYGWRQVFYVLGNIFFDYEVSGLIPERLEAGLLVSDANSMRTNGWGVVNEVTDNLPDLSAGWFTGVIMTSMASGSCAQVLHVPQYETTFTRYYRVTHEPGDDPQGMNRWTSWRVSARSAAARDISLDVDPSFPPGTLILQREGDFVTLEMNRDALDIDWWTSFTGYTIPVGYRPSTRVSTDVLFDDTTGAGRVSLDRDGNASGGDFAPGVGNFVSGQFLFRTRDTQPDYSAMPGIPLAE